MSHEREKVKWEQKLTDTIHQRDDHKSEIERLKIRVDNQLKEIERLRHDNRNQRRNINTNNNNANPNSLGNVLGAGIIGRFNLPKPAGFQPGMY